MLNPASWKPARLDVAEPLLVVVVDTEEEFDWSRPLARENTAVGAMAAQHRAHRVFEKYRIRPTYVIDYPVASQEDGSRPLAELYADGLCLIGSHLHPWVNPPFEEAVTNLNSYPGNLPAALEREKLRRLTEAIEDRFELRPTIYKAGRYGVGPNTTAALEALGYEIDASVVPQSDFSAEDGPDFSACGARPYWFGRDRRLLEIPPTVGFTGATAPLGREVYRLITGDAGKRIHAPGIFSRLKLLDRLRLSPEGVSHEAHRRLTRRMLREGHRVFSFTYHSPSLEPGCTPYVRSEAGLAAFLDLFERYFDWFMGELGGRPATPAEILALASRPHARAA